MSCWSRDRWLALSPGGEGDPVTLLAPRGEAAAQVWPERAGDRRIAGDLARAFPRKIRARRSELFFDGGDFVADERTVFVTPAVARRNLGGVLPDRAALVAALRRLLKRRVVLLDQAPDHHAGMFMMTAGNGRIAVSDPRLAAGAQADVDGLLAASGGADFTPGTQARFDAVAARCEAAGYRVLRMPVVPAKNGRAWLSYLNVILDQRGGRRVVYMPTFEGAEPLNGIAAAAWGRLGFDVRPVDCSGAYAHFGTLRCLVNVVRRGRHVRSSLSSRFDGARCRRR